MKKIVFSCLMLLLCVTANAATTSDAEALYVDSIRIYGNHLAMLTQHMEVHMSNPSASAFERRLYLQAHDKATGQQTLYADMLMALDGSLWAVLRLDCQLPEGTHELTVSTDEEGQQPLCSTEVVIDPLRKLNLMATITLDMLSEDADGNVLYGSRLRGRVTVKSEGDDYYGVNGGQDEDDGLLLWLEDEDSGEELYLFHISDKIYAYSFSMAVFTYDAVFRDGGRLVLKVGYAAPGGKEVIEALPFTMHSGTNTYWTADGHVLPLPINDAQQLVVPAEAVAVDLRGQQAPSNAVGFDASQANPNCLYYLDLLADVPQGLHDGLNLIRGLEAPAIRLTEGYDYFCPLAFHADLISYLMTPSYDSDDDELRGRGYSETIVLPFNPSYASLYDVNDGAGDMLHADMLTILLYGGCDNDTLTVSEVNSIRGMKAYAPYVLGVYIGSSLLFIGEDTQVPATKEAIAIGTLFNFIGTTVGRLLPIGTYVYHAADNSFYPTQTEMRISPFHAYINATDIASNYDHLSLSDSAWGTKGNPNDATAINDVTQTATRAEVTNVVYDLCGRMVVNRSLPRGIYIVGGRKVIVR